MKATEIAMIIAIGVVTTIIGNYIWRSLTSNGPATVLPFTKTPCGCKEAV